MLTVRTRRRCQGGRAVAIGASMVVQGAYVHLQGLVGGRLLWFQAGVNGNRTDQVLARMQADVYGRDPVLCLVDAGMNDVINDIPEQTIKGNLLAIRDGLIANAITPIFVTMQPFANAVVWSSARETVRQSLDAFIQTTMGVRYFDLDDATGDGANPPALKAEYDSGDGLHINDAADLVVSTAVFNQVFGGKPY